jgi:hypothetical protein
VGGQQSVGGGGGGGAIAHDWRESLALCKLYDYHPLSIPPPFTVYMETAERNHVINNNLM